MKILFNLIVIICTIWASPVWGQTNFREKLIKTDPVLPNPARPQEEKRKVHQEFLDQAIRSGDAEKQLFGCCYLFKDCIQTQQYPEATYFLLLADSLARLSGNAGWQGAVSHRKGILAVYLKDYKKAIPLYEEAVRLCGEAHDSLCIAENLEQLSSMYGRTGDYAKAHQYFNLAMPLLERYGDALQTGVALNNFGNLLTLQDRPLEAIPYFERALAHIESVGDQRRAVQFLSNLADPYIQLRRFDRALDIYRRCIRINRENDWPENLMSNYAGISEICKQTGDFRAALDFSEQYHVLRDSLLGAATREKIADLEVKYASQQKELDLQKSEAELNATRRLLERRTLFIFLILLLAGIGLGRWRFQTLRAKRERVQHHQNLNDLTRILLEKNTRLAELEALGSQPALQNDTSSDLEEFEENLYNQRILTNADWGAFKTYFEKAYPGYILRLRKVHPALSDAEERLYLFIKLNLTTKESAAMLGISVVSVKRTRNRLRKRLGLEEEQDLDDYIRDFIDIRASQN